MIRRSFLTTTILIKTWERVLYTLPLRGHNNFSEIDKGLTQYHQSQASTKQQRYSTSRKVGMGGSKQGIYTYEWPRPAVTVDAILVTTESRPRILLIQRKNDPYGGSWALPGGFVDEMEELEVAARRELQEETSINPDNVKKMIQIGAFSEAGRDPRGWTIGVGYAALVSMDSLNEAQAADDAADAKWFDIKCLPEPLAFDHKLIVRTAFEKLALEPSTSELPGMSSILLEAASALSGDWRH